MQADGCARARTAGTEVTGPGVDDRKAVIVEQEGADKGSEPGRGRKGAAGVALALAEAVAALLDLGLEANCRLWANRATCMPINRVAVDQGRFSGAAVELIHYVLQLRFDVRLAGLEVVEPGVNV